MNVIAFSYQNVKSTINALLQKLTVLAILPNTRAQQNILLKKMINKSTYIEIQYSTQ